MVSALNKVAHIVSRANTEDLMVMYSLPAFTKGDATAFLSGVARSNRLVKKVCLIDHLILSYCSLIDDIFWHSPIRLARRT